MSKLIFIIVCEFLIIFVILIKFNLLTSTNSRPLAPTLPKKINVSTEKKLWGKYIRGVGAKNAYSDFKKVYNHHIPYYDGHTAIHFFGELLFEIEGSHGITICDNSFLYGCYHGFFSALVKNKSLSQIQILDKLCLKDFDSYCQHGMGHGILEIVGSNKLVKALEICDTLSNDRSINACRSGVFMEYNSTKDINASIGEFQIYFPCYILPQKYQYSCYYEQPKWWNIKYQKDYKKMGVLCANITSSMTKPCFRGLGLIAAYSSSFQFSDIVKKCDKINDAYGNMLCKSSARTVYKLYKEELHLENKRVDSFCDNVKESLKKICLSNG